MLHLVVVMEEVELVIFMLTQKVMPGKLLKGGVQVMCIEEEFWLGTVILTESTAERRPERYEHRV